MIFLITNKQCQNPACTYNADKVALSMFELPAQPRLSLHNADGYLMCEFSLAFPPCPTLPQPNTGRVKSTAVIA